MVLPKSAIPGMEVRVIWRLYKKLPVFVTRALQEGLTILGGKHKGFDSAEATLLAVESRTSSPVRIPRDRETYMHPQAEGLLPCGEGPGFAGGIMSAAMDGEKCAEAAVRYLVR